MVQFSDLIMVLCFIFGLSYILFPHLMWKIQHFLSVRGGEPSTLYLIGARVSGGIMVLISLYLAYARFFIGYTTHF